MKKRIILFICKIAILFFALITISHLIVIGTKFLNKKAIEIKSELVEKLTHTKIIKEYVKVNDLPLEDLIQVVAKEYNISNIILETVTIKESNFGDENYLYRFEPRVYEQRRKLDYKLTESERRAMASSHGITQIMGYRAKPDCGVHWSKLYDNKVALRCTAHIMLQNIEVAASKKRTKSEVLWTAFKLYNGSEQYANDAMKELGKILFNKFSTLEYRG